MRKRNLGLGIVLSLVFVATLALPYRAIAAPTQLHIVRASDGSLWKMTCDRLTCSGFTSFPGNFASQPTVTWDQFIGRYVLIGVAGDGSIWRSTFSVSGAFQNDWTVIPGNASSPVGSATGDFNESQVWYHDSWAATDIGTSCINDSGASLTVAGPGFYGVVVVEADVILEIDHTLGVADHYKLFIGENATECMETQEEGEIVIEAEIPTGTKYVSAHVTRSFPISAETKTFYLNGIQETPKGTSDSFWYVNMKALFHAD